jgi:hypothetical protein
MDDLHSLALVHGLPTGLSFAFFASLSRLLPRSAFSSHPKELVAGEPERSKTAINESAQKKQFPPKQLEHLLSFLDTACLLVQKEPLFSGPTGHSVSHMAALGGDQVV